MLNSMDGSPLQGVYITLRMRLHCTIVRCALGYAALRPPWRSAALAAGRGGAETRHGRNATALQLTGERAAPEEQGSLALRRAAARSDCTVKPRLCALWVRLCVQAGQPGGGGGARAPETNSHINIIVPNLPE